MTIVMFFFFAVDILTSKNIPLKIHIQKSENEVLAFRQLTGVVALSLMRVNFSLFQACLGYPF